MAIANIIIQQLQLKYNGIFCVKQYLTFINFFFLISIERAEMLTRIKRQIFSFNIRGYHSNIQWDLIIYLKCKACIMGL